MQRPKKILVLTDLEEPSLEQDFSKDLKTPAWETERDVILALEKRGYQVLLFGMHDELDQLQKVIQVEKPFCVYNLCESYRKDRKFESHITAYLELLGIHYTGASSATLSLCKNKGMTKKLLLSSQVRTPGFDVFCAGDQISVLNQKWNTISGFKSWIVKPNALESSQGLTEKSLVYSKEQAFARMEYLFKNLSEEVLIEEFIEGKDLYVSTIHAGSGKYLCFGPRELVLPFGAASQKKIATYNVKWNEGYRMKHQIQTIKSPMGAALNKQVLVEAEKITLLLGLDGYARLDFRLSSENELYFLEANPNPSLAREDDFAMAVIEDSKMEYEDLVEFQVLKRAGSQKSALKFASMVSKLSFLFLIFLNSGFAVESHETLVPPNQARKTRPVYSQDKFKEVDVTDKLELPQYSQDRYQQKKTVKDYSAELRNTTVKGRENSETFLAQGVLALNQNDLVGAEASLQKAVQENPQNFLAYEYLGETYEAKNNPAKAIEMYVRAKHIAPEARFGGINYQIGRIYFLQKNYERARVYLDLALEQKGHLVPTNYLIGYMYYLQKNYLEAEPFLRTARVQALKYDVSDSDRKLIQAIHYYLGEVYARLGYVDYAASMLRQTEYGDSWELRNTAWRIHAELNRPQFGFGGAFGALYDSNVILLSQTGTLPTEFASQASVGTLAHGFGFYETSPVNKFRFGAEAQLQLNNYFSSNADTYDVLYFSSALRGDFWDQKEWLARLRLDVTDAQVDRKKFDRFQTTYGPTLSLKYFPFTRWNYEVGASVIGQNFAGDLTSGPDQRNGFDTTLFLRAFVESPNPKLRPQLKYSYTISAAEGENFRAENHLLYLGLQWDIGQKSTLFPLIQLRFIDYPDHFFDRNDFFREFKLSYTYRWSEQFVLFADASKVFNASTVKTFEYNRTVLTSGISFQY